MEAGDQGTAKPWKSLPEAIQSPPLPGPAVERQTSGQRRAEIEVETSGQGVKGWWGEGEPRKAPEEAGPHEEERDREEAGGRGRRSETIEPTQPAGLELWRPAGRATPRPRAGPGELRGTGEGAGVGRPSPCRSSPPPLLSRARAALASGPQVPPLRVAACGLLRSRVPSPLRGAASAHRKRGQGPGGGAAPVAMETGAALGTTTGDQGILEWWAGHTLPTVCLFFPSDPSPGLLVKSHCPLPCP